MKWKNILETQVEKNFSLLFLNSTIIKYKIVEMKVLLLQYRTRKNILQLEFKKKSVWARKP